MIARFLTGGIRRTRLKIAGIGLTTLVAVVFNLVTASRAGEVRIIPPPAKDEKSQASSETALFAGGCFWGVQGIFQHVQGVERATSGYAGGSAAYADYEAVSTGMTGHAEAVEIKFDPKVVSYGRLLQIYFSVAHDPTQLNRQGPDEGTQYRSTIFAQTDAQAAVARSYITQLSKARVFSNNIVTTIEAGKVFYAAESYHQNFLTDNPSNPYIVINDLPKIKRLWQLFPDDFREEPVLVTALD